MANAKPETVDAASVPSVIREISLNRIKRSRNSRLSVAADSLAGLMQSIKETGLLQPIGVVETSTGKYEVCYGNRRFLACSKLGHSKIQAVVHAPSADSDMDLKNLTENIQRTNISLAEAGRYIEILEKAKLTKDEIAVRLGVSRSYVAQCATAYREVPEEYRNSLEVRQSRSQSTKRELGKIAIGIAQAIINTQKTHRLTKPQAKKLFEAAKTSPEFNRDNIPAYAHAIKDGKSDFLKAGIPMRRIGMHLMLKESEARALEREFVDEGPFNSLQRLVVAILRGEKSVTMKVK